MAPVRAQTRLDQDQTCRRGREGDGAGMEEVCGVIIQVWAVEDRDRLRCQLVLIVRPPAAATHAEFLGKTVLARLLPAGTPRGRGLGSRAEGFKLFLEFHHFACFIQCTYMCRFRKSLYGITSFTKNSENPIQKVSDLLKK